MLEPYNSIPLLIIVVLVGKVIRWGRQVAFTARGLVGVVACLLVMMPLFVAFGARAGVRGEIARLKGAQEALEIENSSYRAATAELTTQLESLQAR